MHPVNILSDVNDDDMIEGLVDKNLTILMLLGISPHSGCEGLSVTPL